jgi:hypothetical protein
LVIDCQKQKADNGRVKSAIGISVPGASIQEYNCKGRQADAYDINTVAELRNIMDFYFGGENDWDAKDEWTIRYGDNKFDPDIRTIVHNTVTGNGAF